MLHLRGRILYYLLLHFGSSAIRLNVNAAFDVPVAGRATLTHYDLPQDYIASCGCVGASTHYPTAALNALAFGSSASYGPQCGLCYRLQLESTVFTPPPPDGHGRNFSQDDLSAPSIVVKITDSCPYMERGYCSQTADHATNMQGSAVHFDLAWPSSAISKSFFPTDDGRDFGVWWITYKLVDCQTWAGYHDRQASGSDWEQQSSACCPLRPLVGLEVGSQDGQQSGAHISNADQQSCPSYSDQMAAKMTWEDLISQVPNTSNILSKKQRGQSNAAWSFTKSALYWTFPFTWPSPSSQIEDWQILDPPLLTRPPYDFLE